jgi:hypothetical protein
MVASQNKRNITYAVERYITAKRDSTNCPYVEKCQLEIVSLKPVIHFSTDSALFEKDSLKNKINKMHKLTHTNKYL